MNHRAASETIPELREGDIVLPLTTDGRVVGAIVLAGMKGRILQSDEREFLIAAGRQAARAIDRAQLYETAERGRAEAEALRVDADAALHELQKAQEALRLSEARCRTLAARSNRLYEFSAGLSEAVALDAVAAVIVRQGKAVAGASAGSVALLTEDGSHFEVLYSEEYGAQPDARRRLPVTAGLCPSAAVATKSPCLSARSSSGRRNTRSLPRSRLMADTCPRRRCRSLPIRPPSARCPFTSPCR